ncbi:hypothetical protein QYE76_037130 [Lolium multiflorum]|uniref:DUF7788 domain-containing protein n=1 Tax=Lolium multiflorum TaxID=4521 RepID=A0AAD8R5Q8_LOLMU|nr:hypothetical protein QYE76_037127 [Lolium multiflorum]KAK1613457.1 hypothetical protein QYE76_037130 [Lolium multiflorum]
MRSRFSSTARRSTPAATTTPRCSAPRAPWPSSRRTCRGATASSPSATGHSCTTSRDKCLFIQRMDWNMNTDFQAVFDKLLQVAVAGNLPPDRMVKKVFVFSDMEFDQASSRPWETDYEAITRKYSEAGYGDAVPQIVFWNLRDSRSVPVTAEQKGVALVSGFSKNMLKIFLGAEEEAIPEEEEQEAIPGKKAAIPSILTPRDVMEKAISGPEYQKLVVFD